MKPKYDIIELIKLCKANVERKENLMKIIECMQPMINKYARMLYGGEFEDMQQELVIAVIEAVNKMEAYDNEGKVIKFLINAVKNRFYELYRKSKMLENEESSEAETLENVYNHGFEQYEDIEFKIDVEKITNCNSMMHKRIACYILYNDIGDAEIAKRLNVSRQYVNRSKKVIFRELEEYVLNK